jgi:hypothetical protein
MLLDAAAAAARFCAINMRRGHCINDKSGLTVVHRSAVILFHRTKKASDGTKATAGVATGIGGLMGYSLIPSTLSTTKYPLGAGWHQ